MARMDGSPAGIETLRDKVRAAQQEFDMAVTFHEIWKPAAYDTDLHARMGTSYATQAFLIIRTALRREMVLALVRLWDRRPHAVRMEEMARMVSSSSVMQVLVAERARRISIPGVEDDIRSTMEQKAAKIAAIVVKYERGGSHHAILKKLHGLRNERLAHRQVTSAVATGAGITDQEIEEFYQDNSALIQALLSLVDGMAYDPSDTASVFRHYAGLFWAAVRGEQTGGHPNYRATTKASGG